MLSKALGFHKFMIPLHSVKWRDFIKGFKLWHSPPLLRRCSRRVPGTRLLFLFYSGGAVEEESARVHDFNTAVDDCRSRRITRRMRHLLRRSSIGALIKKFAAVDPSAAATARHCYCRYS